MYSGLSDSELVRRVFNGDLDAFTALVHRYQDVVYAAAYSVVRNFHDAKDVAQEAWIKAYLWLITCDPNTHFHFGAWLYTISKRRAIDWLRSRQRLPVEDLSAAVNTPDPRPQPDEEQEKKEIYEMVHRALSSLSKVNRETTVLYYINGYSQRDISGILGIPLGTVKRRLHDSREFLREEIISMVKEAFEESKPAWQDMVPKRITERARTAINYANEEAIRLGHNRIDTEHLLLGLLREGQGIAVVALRKLGINLDELEKEVRRMIKEPHILLDKTRRPLIFTDASSQVFQHAMEETQKLKLDAVYTDQILLGLIREESGIASKALVSFGVTLDRLRVLLQIPRKKA